MRNPGSFGRGSEQERRWCLLLGERQEWSVQEPTNHNLFPKTRSVTFSRN